MRVLILGGTSEGHALAGELAARGVPHVSSLAGRLAAPRLPDGEVRVGGFGGAAGLADYLRDTGVAAVIDATHPFAAGITGNADAACRAAGIPLLVLRRPPWTPRTDDRWEAADDLAAAAGAVQRSDADARVLLSIGRQGVAAFADCPQQFWIRSIQPPADPLPGRCTVLPDRGPFTLDGELALLGDLAIDVLVSKNSGGPMTVAKVEAARLLGVGVVMIGRPALPDGVHTVPDVPACLAWLTGLDGGGRTAPQAVEPVARRSARQADQSSARQADREPQPG
jgi:precorrin-6A/cobalt-precorrin-6A reductase